MDYTLSTIPDIYNIYIKINKDVNIKEYDICIKSHEIKKIYLSGKYRSGTGTHAFLYFITKNKYLYFITKNKYLFLNHQLIYNNCLIHLELIFFEISIENKSDHDANIKIFEIYKNRMIRFSNIISMNNKYLDNKYLNNIIFGINNYGCRCNKIQYSCELYDTFYVKSNEITNKDIIYINSQDIILMYKNLHIYDNNYELKLYKIINKKNNKSMIFNLNITPMKFNNIFHILEEKMCQIYELFDQKYIDAQLINFHDLCVTYKIYYIFGNSLELKNHDC